MERTQARYVSDTTEAPAEPTAGSSGSLMTSQSVARRVGVCAGTVRMWERLGRLPAIRTESGTRLFFPLDVEKLIAERAAAKDQHREPEPAR